MVNLFLERMFCKPTYTIGILSMADRYFCNTLEDPVRDLNKDGDLKDYGELKIYGETAIPYGRYEVIVSHSPKFKRDLPLILDVKHFIGIRIHRGNTVKDTAGCILVGDNTAVGKVTNSTYYEKKLTAMLKAYILAGEKVYINIV
jgi:hypothetical protein